MIFARTAAPEWTVKQMDKLQFVHVRDCVEVVRCKDCKHRPIDNRGIGDDYTNFAIEFPDDCCPCQRDDGWYNRYPPDNWFCADGERKDGGEADG